MFLIIKKAMNIIEKLYLLFKTLNMNDNNVEKCHSISTGFIRKLADLFFMIVGEKESTNIPLSKMYCLGKSETLTRINRSIYLELDG